MKLTLALISLLADAPDELLAVGAERRLAQEERHELVTRHLCEALLLRKTRRNGIS